jgi:hypothetical protein
VGRTDRSRTSGANARTGGRWTDEELQRLRELWGLRSEERLAREFGRSVESVRRAAARAFDGRLRRGPWSEEELDRLRQHLGASPVEVVAKVLGRRVADVRAQVEELASRRRRGRWTREELALLRKLYGTRRDEDLEVIFGRPVGAIQRMAKRYALSKDKAFVRRIAGEASTRMPRWSADELELLRELYPDTPNLEIAHRVGRSIKSVVSKAHQLGLRKNIERLREMVRENVAARYGERR